MAKLVGLDKSCGKGPGKIAMGCEALGGVDWGVVDLASVKRAVKHAWDIGVNCFDTADVYGLGRSEEELGKALGAHRHKAFIVSKFGVRWKHENNLGRATTYRDSSPQYLVKAIEDSLRRLRVDAISMYLVHWPDRSIPIEETLFALDQLKKNGKILNYGLSNLSVDEVTSSLVGWGASAYQGGLNILSSDRERLVLEKAHSVGLNTFAYGPLAQGLLSGKYSEDSEFGLDDRRHRLPHFAKKSWDNNKIVLKVIEDIANSRNVTAAEVSVRWVIDSGVCDVVVLGAKNPEQIDTGFNALSWELTQCELHRIGAAVSTKLE